MSAGSKHGRACSKAADRAQSFGMQLLELGQIHVDLRVIDPDTSSRPCWWLKRYGERHRASVMCKWLSVATVLARSYVDASLCRGGELIEVN